MSDEQRRWEQVQRLFAALEAVPAGEREDYLARACPDDPELRREVLTLLAVEPEADAYLEGLTRDLAPDLMDSPDLRGRQVGAYRLSRLLGRGGMGVVYEAARVDGAFEQRVALKLLTMALAGTEAHRRFLAERQILAGLEHPAIARIVDGGVGEDGTPWFAMEHVEGVPIDAYCDQRQLGIRERLELFLQVCDAVEHAHRRLVVHRDLKPTNVLVTRDQKVKLLDFGIAKLLAPDGAPHLAPPTRTAVRMMTPEYASPEQVRDEPVTTASDVYQLGLLLYELLTGHRPYSLRHRRAGELERVICEQVPTRLTAVVTQQDTIKPPTGVAGWSVEDVCRVRRTSPARLRRRLRGDLENIVLKALRKEPEHRYGSADRLAQDIRRHLDGLPVTARSGTWIYHGRKFLERHAVGATAAATTLVLAIALISLHTARVQRERDRAEAEAAKAAQMSQFLTGLFRGADPREARGAELTARELLDRGVRQVNRELAGQPDVRADIMHVLGRTYLELGLFTPADRLLTGALELRQRRDGPQPREVAVTLSDLGLLRYRQGELEQARERLEEAVRMLEDAPGGEAAELAVALQNLGQTYRRLGEPERGLATLERALAIQVQASGESSAAVADILTTLGGQLLVNGDLVRAEDVFQRALAIHERELGANHPRVGLTLMNLATARLEQGKLAGLEAMYRRSLAIHRQAYGPVHAAVATALNNLGHFLAVSGRDEEAVDVLQRALEVLREATGPHHPAIAGALTSLGDAHFAAGRLREARDYYQQSIRVRGETLGARQFDPILAHGLVQVGRIDAALGDEVAAEQSLSRALAIWSQAPERVDVQLAPTLIYLGRRLAEQQRCAEAAPLLRRAVRIERARRAGPSAQARDLRSLLAGCSGDP